MDAVRLIAAGRHALAQSGAAMDIVGEAWQAQALTQGIGSWLAVTGPRELRSEARGLGEAGGRGCGVLDRAALRGEGSAPDYPPRAAQLTEVADVRQALLGLQALLGEVGIALVGVACATDDEGLYWQCIESIDAADESSDRVRAVLRRLAVRERGSASGVA
ncbi:MULTISPECIES: DUF6099 family protein [unclassified Streptomyces]|uniref:DUF6099 family protein n=1 Tax=unclassified Streptomyces TaxID=2593676 RepID=UPI000ADBD831|nr:MULTISPECIES: DUF6099 family protein [unclassified Streptomyces]MCX5150125.1 DUF6099 family protein [Streptomyces sp. NBC_00320]WSN48172.1 DUF6099 family protein [Streptomyces sp. NBC_01296]WSW62399.1 DUF6099 family protein [Streptomyces sp. NBC_00998]